MKAQSAGTNMIEHLKTCNCIFLGLFLVLVVVPPSIFFYAYSPVDWDRVAEWPNIIHGHPYFIHDQPYFIHGHPLRTAVLIFLVAGAILTARFGFRYAKASYRADWFRPVGDTTPPDWEEVKNLLRKDPLERNSYQVWRSRYLVLFCLALRDVVVAECCIAIFILAGIWVISGNNEEIIWSNSQSVLAAVIAGFAGLAVAFFQLRAKVQSENRQRWIDQVRESMSELISNIPRHNASPFQVRKALDEMKSHRIKMELLINPSEPDHRTLSTLIRIAYGIDDPIRVDKTVLCKLKGIIASTARPINEGDRVPGSGVRAASASRYPAG